MTEARQPDWSRMSATAIARALGVRPADPAAQRILLDAATEAVRGADQETKRNRGRCDNSGPVRQDSTNDGRS